MQKQIHLLADKSVKYRLIDEIVTEIASTNSSRNIIFRSNSDSKKSRDVRGLKHKVPMSYYSFTPPKYLKTQKEIKEMERITDQQSEVMPNFPVVPDMESSKWIANVSVETAVYSLQKDLIHEALEAKRYECFFISNKGLLNADNKVMTKDDIKNALLKNDIIFLKYDSELLYGNYINLIAVVKEMTSNYVRNSDTAEVIELSNQIQDLHKKVDIELCN